MPRFAGRRRPAASANLALFLLVLVFPLALAGPAPPARAGEPPLRPQAVATNDRFGFAFVNGVTEASGRGGTPETWYGRAREAGAGWTRWPIYWHKIETERGRFDYTVAYPADKVVELDVRSGLRTDAILIGTPAWGGISSLSAAVPFDVARKQPPGGELQLLGDGSPAAVPEGLDRPVFLANGAINPDNIWARFVYNTVSRYKPGGELARKLGWGPKQGITHWELWNEPDLRWNVGGQQVPAFWRGTADDYYRLLKVGYQAAKAADPNAVVLFAGLAYWSQPDFLGRALDRLVADPEARGRGFFFDVLPLHFYVDAENVYRYTQWAQGEMQKRGFAKPIWLNETNAPVWGDNTSQPFGPWLANTEEQAAFVIHALAYALAAGVERTFIFQLYEDGEPTYGVIRSNDTTRPAYTAYQVAATYFAAAQQATRERRSNVEIISLLNPTRGKVTVVWNTATTQTSLSVAATAPTAMLVDKYGGARPVTAANGSYTVVLPPGAAYRDAGSGIEWRYGGDPYILVEQVYGALSSRVAPLPTYSPSTGFRVSWSRQDALGGTASYYVQYRIGLDGLWLPWPDLLDTTQTAAVFGPNWPVPLVAGQTYYFRVRARLAGAVEDWPQPEVLADAFTTIVRVDPQRYLPFVGRSEFTGFNGW